MLPRRHSFVTLRGYQHAPLDNEAGVMEKSRMKMGIMLACAIAATSSVAIAQNRATATERPEVLNRLTACRAIASDAERLACFDQQVAALEAAEQSREIAVVDRQQIRRTRRSLFGLTLPDLGIFSDDEDEGAEGAAVNEINSTIQSASAGSDGRMVFVLAEGGTWVQTEGRRGRAPRSGEAIRIRRGPLGSFIANVEDRPAVRVIRLR